MIDNNLSPQLAQELRLRGVDATHVRDFALASASDAQILGFALLRGKILVSRDADFGAMLANAGDHLPSFVHLRAPRMNSPAEQAALLVEILSTCSEDLLRGAIVSVARGKIRIRTLPVRP